MAEGELLMWVNGDDEVVPEGVRAAVEHLRRTPGCQVVYGGLDFTDADGTLRRPYRPACWSWLRYLLLGDYVPTPTFIFRAGRAAQVGELDERFVDAADYDFYLRLTHGVRVDPMELAHVRYRWGMRRARRRRTWGLSSTRRRRSGWHGRAAGADGAVMVAFDRGKRALLPALTRGRWPEPF